MRRYGTNTHSLMRDLKARIQLEHIWIGFYPRHVLININGCIPRSFANVVATVMSGTRTEGCSSTYPLCESRERAKIGAR
jgi:hypothetical protein